MGADSDTRIREFDKDCILQPLQSSSTYINATKDALLTISRRSIMPRISAMGSTPRDLTH